VRALIRELRRGFRHLKFRVEDAFTDTDRAAVRWTVSGTHEGEFMGVPPTHKAVSVEGIEVVRVADGRIAEDPAVWDALGLMRQPGAVPAC
jgi:steroid delta-isomerase-like uncharacterized protein